MMKNVVVVDNDAIMLHTFVGLLKSHGGFLTTIPATSSKAALAILSRETVHILIAGLHLSEMDTFELLSKVTKSHPQLRVIVLTNNASAMFRTNIKQMPSVVHFDQALDISLLTKRKPETSQARRSERFRQK
jgi:DNA-binding NtrC family response regulator